ncbi:type II secretion system major pseudopilin GspG [Tateyamaria omphalii]|uniref:type II secretion system major pseudopilin GspG n=1 Tax=Tateyamaria omphalii TaxID=299262 RepID=UPI001C99402D|nr:type II secretion system major pseudopilin GspG [Tateyamaria omphalii]MBY5934924.1 type II secretion system major pseudopilin GspG [Tateyamaria omphalii]
MTRSANRRQWSSRTGATILEVLIVLSIIAMIAAVVGPRLVGYLGRAKTETAALQIDQLRNALQLFYIDAGRYPSSAEGLSALYDRPAGLGRWNGPYLETKNALIDPWGRPYIYDAPSQDHDFAVSSLGRDGVSGGDGEDADVPE